MNKKDNLIATINNPGSIASMTEKNINLIFVGWVERSETNISSRIVRSVGFRSLTQPTINVVLHQGNGRAKILNLAVFCNLQIRNH